jgi:hypothetical protein
VALGSSQISQRRTNTSGACSVRNKTNAEYSRNITFITDNCTAAVRRTPSSAPQMGEGVFRGWGSSIQAAESSRRRGGIYNVHTGSSAPDSPSLSSRQVRENLTKISLLGRHATSGRRIIVQVSILYITYDPSVKSKRLAMRWEDRKDKMQLDKRMNCSRPTQSIFGSLQVLKSRHRSSLDKGTPTSAQE